MNLRKLLGKQKIVDMSRVMASPSDMKRKSTKGKIDEFFKDTCAENVKWTYNAQTNKIDIDGDCILNIQGFSEFPEYINIGIVNGDFEVNHVNDLVSTFGFPVKVNGNFTIEGIGRYTKLNNTDNFPEYVKGEVHIKKCPQIGKVNIQNKPKVIKDSYEEDLDLTEEQHDILDYASNLLSEDEYNALEDFFYSQNE